MIQISTGDSIPRWATKNAKKLILLFFVAMLTFHVVFTFSGYYNDDDVNYARHAAAVAEHGVDTTPATDHFQLRWSTVYPAALFFKFFGMNSITSALGSMLSFFLCGLLLYLYTKQTGNLQFLLLLSLFLFSHTVLENMHRLLPDATMCLAVFWMYFSYRQSVKASAKNYALGFAAGFFLAVITKETIIIALPLFIILFLRDIWKKQNLVFWKYAILFVLIFMIPYLLYFLVTTGSMFYRFKVLNSGGYFNACSFDQMPFVFTINRVAFDLWWNQLMAGDMLLIIPAVGAVLYRKQLFQTRAGQSEIFAFVILLLSTNFMSISWRAYIPLCPASRHFIFIFPFAAIIGSRMLQAYFLQPLKFKLLPILFFATTVAAFFNPGSVKFLYLLMFLLLLIVPIAKGKLGARIHSYIFTIGIVAIFFLNYLAAFLHPVYSYYFDQKKITEKNFQNKHQAITVFSADDFSSELNEYFLNFRTGQLKFLPITYTGHIQDSIVYFLVNAQITPQWQSKTDSMMQKSNGAIKLWNQVNQVYLYRVTPEYMRKIRGW